MVTERFGQIRIEALPRLHVAQYRAVSATPEEDAKHHMAQWRAAQCFTGPYRHFGFDNDVSEAQAQLGFRGYEVWTTVDTTARPSQGVTLGDFPGGLYAAMDVFEPFSDPFEIIPAGWVRLHAWVTSAHHVCSAHHQWLEELIEGEHTTTLRLLHPIVPTDAETHLV